MNSLADYVVAFVPLFIGHMSVPTLSYFRGEQPPEQLRTIFHIIYDLAPQELLKQRVVKSMMLYNDVTLNVDLDFNWNRVTHLFVHSNYEHLLNNLVAAFQFGYPVYREFGTQGLYSLFFLGGIFASWPSQLHSHSRKIFSQAVENHIGTVKSKLPEFVSKRVDKLKITIAPAVESWMASMGCCGSSGAVFALLGCGGVLGVSDCCREIHTAIQIVNSEDSLRGPAKTAGEQAGVLGTCRLVLAKTARVMRAMNIQVVGFQAIGIFRAVRYIQLNVNKAFDTKALQNDKLSLDSLNKAIDLCSVGYVAHVQGAAFGAAFAVVFGMVVPSLQRHWSRKS